MENTEPIDPSALQAALIEPESVAPVPDGAELDAKEKRRQYDKERRARQKAERAGPQAVSFDSIMAEVGGNTDAPKRGRGRPRAAKITGDDVAGAVSLFGSLAAMFTKQAHWIIPPEEVKPWSGEAAELLNRIPSKYVAAAAGFSGYLTVAAGIYGTIQPRIALSDQINRQRAAATRTASQNGSAADTAADARAAGLLGADVPWADAS